MKAMIDLGEGPRQMCMDCALNFSREGLLILDRVDGEHLYFEMIPGVSFDLLRSIAMKRHGQ